MDSLQEILFTLRQNKLRTALTAFGVFWGILMLILLLGAGRGMEKAFAKDRYNDVPDSLFFFPGVTSIPYKGLPVDRRITFTEEDLINIKQQVPEVRFISSEINIRSMFGVPIVVTYGTKVGSFDVLGVGDQFFNIKEKMQFNDGRRFNRLDLDQYRKVVVIGTNVSDRLFDSHDEAIGKEIQINGIMFRVIGLFYDQGNQGRMSDRIYMPMSGFKKAFGGGENISIISARPKEGVDGILLEEKILSVLRQRHSIAPNDLNAMWVANKARSAQQVKSMFSALNAFIWLVGIGTLLAGIVGVSNIMIITVKERTREIGIRKALGAHPSAIVWSLLFESVLVTSLAGYAGLVMGVATLEGVSALLTKMNIELPYFQQPEIDMSVALSALLLLIVAGVLAGLMPALRAARIMPIEAMRAE